MADRKNNRIQKLRLDNRAFVSKIGKKGTGNGEFREPRAVALSKKEHLYVADGFNHRVQVFSEEKFIFSLVDLELVLVNLMYHQALLLTNQRT